MIEFRLLGPVEIVSAGRPVDAGKSQIGEKCRRCQPVDEIRRLRVGYPGRFALGIRTWHVCDPVFLLP